MTPQNDLVKRVEIIMKVQLGQMNATAASKELGITRQHYYRIEKEFLKQGLNAVSPQKRGRKVKQADPKMKQLEDDLQKGRRERELLEIKLKDTQYLNGKLQEALSNKEERRKKKTGSRDGKIRQQIHTTVQTVDSGIKNGSITKGETDNAGM